MGETLKCSSKLFRIAIVLTALFGCTIATLFLTYSPAFATTAAEKQAEADAVYAQIDSLQTSLNEATERFENAEAAYNEAVELRDEAQRQIKEETAHINSLQEKLSSFAESMYKKGGTGSFLDVILQSTSFEELVTSWDACNTVSRRGSNLVKEAQETKAKLEEAEATYQEQSVRAERERADAEATQQQIAETQAALREEASKLSAEAAELQAQEELQAEAARQAEEARIQREAEIASGYGYSSAGSSVLMGNGYFTHPCPSGSVSSTFGYRTFDNSFHRGLDLAAAEGTPYYAADGGTVLYATNDGGYNGGAGNWVVIAHGNGIVTKYMHSSATFVHAGEQVSRGQNIGLVGNTGNSFGAHLHFQVEVDGVAVNPQNYL